MNDEQRTQDERIRAAARELYHAPPETPRDEIWAEIEPRIDSASTRADARSRTPSGPSPLRSRRALESPPSRRFGWWVGIAAALAIGLGIGRLTTLSGPNEVRMASDAAVTDGDTAVAEMARSGASEAVGLQHAAATRQLLSRGESFLTTVQTDLASGGPDPEMGMWARSLLSRTRVLMASPATRTPETRRLLEDLELMLAQIVVTSVTEDPGEIRILNEELEGGNLLYRLRSANEDDGGPRTFRPPGTSSL